MQQIVGIVIVMACVLGGFIFMGGNVAKLWQPVELLIIVGAAAGALVIGNPRHVLSEMASQVRKVVTGRKRASGTEFQRQLLLLMYELLEVGRDLKALDQHVEAPHESSLFTPLSARAGRAEAAGVHRRQFPDDGARQNQRT